MVRQVRLYSGETVSFEWDWMKNCKYRNTACQAVVAWDANGEPKHRGERGTKAWRTADTRFPARRSEWND